MYPVGAVDDDGDGDTVDVDGSLYGIKPVVGPVVVGGAAEEEERSRSLLGRTPLGDCDVSAEIMQYNKILNFQIVLNCFEIFAFNYYFDFNAILHLIDILIFM